MNDTNRQLLVSAARLLRPLLEELVFVGGCATGTLITDEAATKVRATMDVDAIAEITSYSENVRFGERLRDVGFTEDTSEGAPLCRWRQGDVILDVMPLDERILGFSNRWYREAMYAAEVLTLEPSLEIRVITAPFFLATKLEAFKGRGGGDYFASHDLEDVLSVIDGRSGVAGGSERPPLMIFAGTWHGNSVRSCGTNVSSTRYQVTCRPDAASQARIPILRGRLEELTRR